MHNAMRTKEQIRHDGFLFTRVIRGAGEAIATETLYHIT